MSLLEVKNLVVDFTTPAGTLRAVNGLSFDLDQGKAIGIVGESGSGKSVVARTIMGILAGNGTATGQVMFDGRDILDLDKSESKHFFGVEIAMVFQDPMTSLNPVKRVDAQLTEALRYHKGLSKADATKVAIDLLDQVQIPDARSRLRSYPHELSGGMRQRVVIAMALACEPRLLIADEPTTALDVTVQKRILDLLGELQRERNMAMILITHDLGVAADRTDQIGVMYAGRIQERAATRKLFSEMRHPYTQALLDSIPDVDAPSHTRLTPIPGRPPDLLNPPVGCKYSPRCKLAQNRCLTDDPLLTSEGDHDYRCHFPVGTKAGADARAANEATGVTAAGLPLDAELEEVV